jgi:amino acid adenylation domain-containing protein
MNRLVKENIKDIYKLSPMQEGMYFQYLYDKDSIQYFSQTSYRILGNLDIDAIRNSLNELFRRYDVLRTVFNHEKMDLPLQVVLKEQPAEFHFEDISKTDNQVEKEKYIEYRKQKEQERKFNLNRDSLLRVALLRIGEGEYEFIWSSHHIIMDGWCLGILISDFYAIYESMIHNQKLVLSEPKQYRLWIEWLEQKDQSLAEKHWREYLNGYDAAAGVTAIRMNTHKEKDYLEKQLDLILTNEEYGSLKRISGKYMVTLSTILKTAWGITLAKLNNQNDVVFGEVVSGRSAEIEGIESMVGLFINTLPARILFDDDSKFDDLIVKIQAEAIINEKYSYYPAPKIQSQSLIKQNLFDNIFVFQNYPLAGLSGKIEDNESASGFKIVRIDAFENTGYDFNLIIVPDQSITISFKYNSFVYKDEMVQRIVSLYKSILTQLLDNPGLSLGNLELLSEEEQDLILYGYNNTKSDYPAQKTINELFEDQAARIPDKPAVIFGDASITYKELNEKAGNLACLLRGKGVTRNSIVGIMAKRSFEMMIGIMGILKAGGAYLPLEPDNPKTDYIIKDSGARIVLVQHKYKNNLPTGIEAVELEDAGVYREQYSGLERINKAEDLAYVIYTSGSTGNPKGVMIEHRSVVNRLNWMQRKYRLTGEDVILQKTPFTFDVSVWELFGWFLAGSKVCFLVPGGEKNPGAIIAAVEKNKVTLMHFVPSMLGAFLEFTEGRNDIERLASLKRIFASGEALSARLVKRFNQTLQGIEGLTLHNLYGPTEATVEVSYFDCPRQGEIEVVPIGKPIDNLRLYIVDKNKRLQPVGIPGEICISGAGVGRGYLNRPELTAEKFIQDPFVAGARMYRTGDMGRLMPDGNIEYLGRTDSQVKIRGFRIELQEVETALIRCKSVKAAVADVQTDENRGSYLIAYLVSDAELSTVELRKELEKMLPEYMIPSYFMRIAEIPLSPNGKIDRKALKARGLTLKPVNEYKKPETDMQNMIIDLWKEIIKVQHIRLDDNFFDIGGTSIDVIKITSRLNKILDKDLPVTAVFTYPTVNLLSAYLTLGDNQSANYSKNAEKALDAAKSRMKDNIAKLKAQQR